MNEEQIKNVIRAAFAGKHFRRWWFITMEWFHASVNVPREALRALGAKDAPAGKANWADWTSRAIVAGPCLFVVLCIEQSLTGTWF